MFTRAALISLLLASVVAAQTAAPPGAAPVDQNVGDLDALSVSTRQIQSGLRNNGEQTSLYRIDPQAAQALTGQQIGGANDQPVYYRVGPGFAATLDRMDYVVKSKQDDRQLALDIAARRDGEFVEIIPPNTVFILDPEAREAAAVENDPATDPRQDYRIDGRIDGRIDRSVNTMIDARVDNRVYDTTQYRYGRPLYPHGALRPDGNYDRAGRRYAAPVPVDPTNKLSIRRTLSTRPATRATTPPVNAGSTQSN